MPAAPRSRPGCSALPGRAGPRRRGRPPPFSADGCTAGPGPEPARARWPAGHARGVEAGARPGLDAARPQVLEPLPLEHPVTVEGHQQQGTHRPDEDEEEIPGSGVASEIEEMDEGRNHQPPALCALVTSSRFSATITSAVNPTITAKARTVPVEFLSWWRLIGVPGASQIRRGDSWLTRVLLPHSDPVHQQVDVVVDRLREQFVGAPRRHDRALVFLARVAQVDAAVVIIVVEEAQPVLVVQGRTLTALTRGSVTLRAVVLIQLRRLVEGPKCVGDQILVGARLVGRLEVAVVADDA